MWEISPGTRKRILTKENWINWKRHKSWGPWPQNTSLRSLFLACSPHLQPSPTFLHSPGILSTALLSSPNFFFTLPPHLLFWVPGRARSLSDSQDSVTICSPWGNSGAPGWADPVVLVSLLWDHPSSRYKQLFNHQLLTGVYARSCVHPVSLSNNPGRENALTF